MPCAVENNIAVLFNTVENFWYFQIVDIFPLPVLVFHRVTRGPKAVATACHKPKVWSMVWFRSWKVKNLC